MPTTRLLLTSLSLGSSVLSFLSYAFLLKRLGVSAQLDDLFYAASLPLGLSALLSVVLLYLLPTRLTELSQDLQEAALRQLTRWAGLLTAALFLFAAPFAVFGSDRLNAVLLGGFILQGGLSVASALMVCRAQAAGRYILAGLNQFILVLGLATGVALSAATHEVGWVMMGQLAGASVALPLIAKKLGVGGITTKSWQTDGRLMRIALAPLRPHLLHIFVASTAFTLFQPIDAFLCQRLAEGAMSTMAFAQRAWVAAGMLISLGASTIAARTSRDVFQAGGAPALRAMARREVGRILLAGLVVWLAYQVSGRSLLLALMQAKSMPIDDLQRLLDCISWMLMSAPAMSAIPYLFRVQYTLGDYRLPAYIGGAIPVVYAVVAWFTLSRVGIAALPLALGVAWWLALGAALLALHRTAGKPRPTPPALQAHAETINPTRTVGNAGRAMYSHKSSCSHKGVEPNGAHENHSRVATHAKPCRKS